MRGDIFALLPRAARPSKAQGSDMQPNRYNLFPQEHRLTTSMVSKPMDPESALALVAAARSQAGDGKSGAAGLKSRLSQSYPNRRRKPSIAGLSPPPASAEVMGIPQMDSPTIPGRLAFHERSMSAPGSTWQAEGSGESCRSIQEEEEEEQEAEDYAAWFEELTTGSSHSSASLKQKPSALHLNKALPPLAAPRSIPSSQRQTHSSGGHRRSGSCPVGPEQLSRHARLVHTPSPLIPDAAPVSSSSLPSSRPFTPLGITTAATPTSAPVANQPRSIPWAADRVRPLETKDLPRAPSANGVRSPTPELASIMDRGRPRKRSESRNGHRRLRSGSTSVQESSAERRAFEELPHGHRPKDVATHLNAQEIATLQRQAREQAKRFEVLSPSNVESLSKELRKLDESTEYLRRTYTSLRAGRRNLHARICQYLGSCYEAGISFPAMIKHEEALAELDASIDEWVTKLDKSENRRIRVRQKLLEHVAAAAILSPGSSISSNAGGGGSGVGREGDGCSMRSTSSSRHDGLGLFQPYAPIRDISTPPHSPTRERDRDGSSRDTILATPWTTPAPSSPQRVVAQVPSTIFERRSVEDAAAVAAIGAKTTSTTTFSSSKYGSNKHITNTMSLKRADMESIRVYAGDGLYSLLTDVEHQISDMSSGIETGGSKTGSGESTTVSPSTPESKRREMIRLKSQDALTGGAVAAASPTVSRRDRLGAAMTTPLSPKPPTPPAKDKPAFANTTYQQTR